MTQVDEAKRLQDLEKENRILRKQLQRSESNRADLEKVNDQKEALLRRVIQELRFSEKTIQAKSLILQHQAEELVNALEEVKRTQSQLVQSEKMSSLGQLVAGVAHEINNPTNFIYGNLTYAQDYADALIDLIQCYQEYYPNPVDAVIDRIDEINLEFVLTDFPKVLRSMQIGAERIQEIVLSLRTFSRLDEAEVKAVDLHEGIDSTLMILAHRLKAKPGTPIIQVTKDYGELPLVECYPGPLNQVFMNLLGNAIDALEEQLTKRDRSDWLPEITIRTAVTDSLVKICIADNGTGIPESVQTQLFNPFFTTKPIGKGTGLGLSISYQIVVDRHGGNLTCRSLPNQGTEFWIELPIEKVTQN